MHKHYIIYNISNIYIIYHYINIYKYMLAYKRLFKNDCICAIAVGYFVLLM